MLLGIVLYALGLASIGVAILTRTRVRLHLALIVIGVLLIPSGSVIYWTSY